MISIFKNKNSIFYSKKYFRTTCAPLFFLLFLISVIPTSQADEGDYWSQSVNVFNYSCTDGDVDCWTDKRNSLETLPLQVYSPLKPIQVKGKHHICVSFPHLKDSYWVGVAYGIITEGRRLGQKITLFEATQNYPCITKKANWAKKWISDNRSSFAARLVAFAAIEGIFFSASFASIYWIKKRGLMPGLTLSNEFISRDEALHTEFAILLYSKLHKKLNKKRVYEIIQEAVEIEKEFITEAIPCRMIGMNSKLMLQYIEFVADRLVLQLGYDKIYNSSNPFDFMELISVETKVNFFERTNSEYALADKTVADDVFEFNTEF